MSQGPLIIVSGPSGSGKSTVIRRLLEAADLPLRLSVSATTRKQRPGEQDGVHYHYWMRERFEAAIAAGEFLEHAEVFGNYYGTLRSEVQAYRGEGGGVLLEIDVQGAAIVREKCPDNVSVFLKAPSPEVYEERLRKRHTEDEATLRRRLAEALREEARAEEYDYIVTNDQVETAVGRLLDIIRPLFGR
jgi:guanylate kinase